MFTNWTEAMDSFDDLLNSDDTVEIAGIEFYRSELLKKADPIAYRCGLLDYIDGCGVNSDDLDDVDYYKVP